MNTFFKDFGTGLKAYGKAFEIIFSNGLWYFFLFPLLLNVLLIVGGAMGISSLTEGLQNWLLDLVSLENATFWGAVYLKGIMSGFIWIVFKILFYFLFAYVGGYIVIILMSPVFALLSEKTEEILTDNHYPFNPDQLMRDVVRGVIIAVRNMVIELGYMILILILSFIPIVGQVGAFALFFISAYFYGFAFIDYTNERRRLSISQSVDFNRKYKGVAVANGIVFALFMLIPFCGVTLAGFAAIVSVVAATVSTHKIVDLSNNPYAKKKNLEA